jgi:hypothetical protein
MASVVSSFRFRAAMSSVSISHLRSVVPHAD